MNREIAHLRISLLVFAGLLPGVFLALTLSLMHQWSFTQTFALSLFLGIFGVWLFTRGEKVDSNKRIVQLSIACQIISTHFLVRIFGVFEYHHVAEPQFFFGVILIMTASCLISLAVVKFYP